MAIKVSYKFKEGIALESTVASPEAYLGFGAEVAQAIAKNYREVLEKGPEIHSVKGKVFRGMPDQLAMMLGMANPYNIGDAEWRVYDLGVEIEGQPMDLWLSETPEGNCIMAFNLRDARERIVEGAMPGLMASMQYAPDELDELLEALATDLSGEPSQEDAE